LSIIDFRSDTVTRPTPEMRQAMFDAIVGDDVFGDDPTVIALEEKAAAMFGKEKALFVPSGTMGNQISIKVHTSPGEEIILECEAHIYLFEAGGAAFHSGVSIKTIQTDNGIMPLDEIEKSIRADNVHFPRTSLICFENTHNMKSGRIVPLDYMKELYKFAKSRGINVHLDGARIWNAHVATGIPLSEYAKYADSVMACVSKGLSSPVGSLIMGSEEFIKKARRIRKVMGGGMRQAGVLAACGLISLDKMIVRLEEDHDNAKFLADGLSQIQWVTCPDHVDTNILIITINDSKINSSMVLTHLKNKNILAVPRDNNKIRFVTHKDVSRTDVETLIGVMKSFKV
jgi:threonine aldolase